MGGTRFVCGARIFARLSVTAAYCGHAALARPTPPLPVTTWSLGGCMTGRSFRMMRARRWRDLLSPCLCSESWLAATALSSRPACVERGTKMATRKKSPATVSALPTQKLITSAALSSDGSVAALGVEGGAVALFTRSRSLQRSASAHQDAPDEGIRARDPHRSFEPHVSSSHPSFERRHLGLDTLGSGGHPLSGVGQQVSVAVPVEETNRELGLERLHAPRHRRMAHAEQAACRPS